MNISSIFYFSKSTSINTQYSSLWDTGDDTIHKIPHKMKTHWQNQLKISVLVYFKISIELDITRISRFSAYALSATHYIHRIFSVGRLWWAWVGRDLRVAFHMSILIAYGQFFKKMTHFGTFCPPKRQNFKFGIEVNFWLYCGQNMIH